MTSKLRIQLIMPTKGRSVEPERMIRSCLTQRGLSNLFEVALWIVDQNPDDRIESILRSIPKKSGFSIHHLRSEPKGQSHAKNLGLARLDADLVGFPDDDCYYPENLLSEIANYLKRETEIQAWVLPVTDPETEFRPLLRYPNRSFDLEDPTDPRVFLALQVAQFFRASAIPSLRFDEAFCSGSKWGSGEESDFLIRFLQSGMNARFHPAPPVHHPLVDFTTMSEEKIRRYATGLGALFQKHRLRYSFLRSVVRPIAGAALSLARFDGRRARAYLWTAFGRIHGYFAYGRNSP